MEGTFQPVQPSHAQQVDVLVKDGVMAMFPKQILCEKDCLPVYMRSTLIKREEMSFKF